MSFCPDLSILTNTIDPNVYENYDTYATYADLPPSPTTLNRLFFVVDTATYYRWNGSAYAVAIDPVTGTVTSVNAGTNISITGTSVAPIVNVSVPIVQSVSAGTGPITVTGTSSAPVINSSALSSISSDNTYLINITGGNTVSPQVGAQSLNILTLASPTTNGSQMGCNATLVASITQIELGWLPVNRFTDSIQSQYEYIIKYLPAYLRIIDTAATGNYASFTVSSLFATGSYSYLFNVSYIAGDSTISSVTTGHTYEIMIKPIIPSSFNILAGNNVYVDEINGNDSTGTRGIANLPFLTITAACVGANSGDVIIVRPGIYSNETFPIIPKNNCSIIGTGIENCKITATAVTSNTTMFTLNPNTTLNNFQLNMTTATASLALIGVSYNSTDNTSCQINQCQILITSTNGTAGSTLYGIYDASSVSTAYFVNVNNCYISVSNAGQISPVASICGVREDSSTGTINILNSLITATAGTDGVAYACYCNVGSVNATGCSFNTSSTKDVYYNTGNMRAIACSNTSHEAIFTASTNQLSLNIGSKNTVINATATAGGQQILTIPDITGTSQLVILCLIVVAHY